MPLTGSLVNFGAIIAGSALGLVFRKGLPEKYLSAVINVIALIVMALGISYALQGLSDVAQALALIISVILGTIAGTLMRIERGLTKLGEAVQVRMKNAGGRFAEAFTSSTLLYCVGAMAVTGSIQSGLNGDHSILFLKSVMDGVTAVFFASTLGVGVLFSAVPVLIYQGAIALAASALQGVLKDATVIVEMSAAGGIALMALSVNMMGIKKMEVANILPAIFFPIGILPLVNLLMGLMK
jgi:uncharacterized membrane protein YqgA involved in biofilm formation